MLVHPDAYDIITGAQQAFRNGEFGFLLHWARGANGQSVQEYPGFPSPEKDLQMSCSALCIRIQLHMMPEPADAPETRSAGLVHIDRIVHGLPCRVGKTCLRYAHTQAVDGGIGQTVTGPVVFQVAAYRFLPVVRIAVECCHPLPEIGMRRQHLGAHPGLYAGGPPGGADDAHGDFFVEVQLTGKEIGDGRQLVYTFGRNHLPAGLRHIFQRSGGGFTGHHEETDPRMGGGGFFLFSIRPDAHSDGPFHIGLAGGDPNFSHHDIPDRQGFFGRHVHLVRTARGERGHLHHPFAMLIRSGPGLKSGEINGDHGARGRIAPNGRMHALLYHHMIGEDGGEPKASFLRRCIHEAVQADEARPYGSENPRHKYCYS